MKNIAVLLSSSINFSNTGMFSVDHAAYNFFKSLEIEINLTFYVFHISEKEKYQYENFVPYRIYKKIDSDYVVDEIYSSDLIVFWGDFFHSLCYIEGFLKNYIIKRETASTQMKLFYDAFFLARAEDYVFKKAIVFGNSLLFIDREIRDPVYAKNLIKLYRRINIAMPRDIKSYENLAKIISDFNSWNFSQGFDSAFMHRKNRKIKTMRIGLFIGRRSKIKLRDFFNILFFANKYGYKISWIEWMTNNEPFAIRAIKNPNDAINILLHRILATKYKRGFSSNYYGMLDNFDIVVTDTYHLAINALASGCNVFCIGDGTTTNKKLQGVHDDSKKKILFDMIGSSSFYGSPSVENLTKLMCAKNQSENLNIYFTTISTKEALLRSRVKKILGV